jgi:hypothetical protein
MPIIPFLDGFKFEPESKRVMGVAFEMARAALRLSDRSGAVTEILALKIIQLANEGVLDPDRLCEQALLDYRATPSSVQF